MTTTRSTEGIHLSKQLLTIGMAALALVLPVFAEESAPPPITPPSVVTTPAPEGTPAAPVEIATPAPVATNAPSQPAAAPAEPAHDQVVIDYNEADIQSVLRTLATRSGINLILGDEVIGKVTVHLEGVTYEDAMQLIVASKGYAYVKDKGVVQIKSKEALETEPLEVRLQTLNYAKAADMAKTVGPMLTKRGMIQIDVRSNILIISDTPSNLVKIMPVLEALDTETPQVMIEAKFIETTKNPRKDLGVNWSDTLLNHPLQARRPDPLKPVGPDNPNPFQISKNLNGGPWVAATAILDPGDVRLVFSYLNSDVNTELLANPRVVTIDNGKAKIAIAEQYPIPEFQFSESTGAFQISGFTYKDIGIVMSVTPRINKNDYVTLEVAPEVSNQNGVATLASGSSSVQIPIVDTRTAITTVLIKSGNTLAIGGLMQQDSADKYTKVPIMGDLPGIGAMFRSKSLNKAKRDLLIFLTPTIVRPDSQTGYEKSAAHLETEKVYTNDKWMPNDNAQPNPQNLKQLNPFYKPAKQNFGP